jgi:hypothetical protein
VPIITAVKCNRVRSAEGYVSVIPREEWRKALTQIKGVQAALTNIADTSAI